MGGLMILSGMLVSTLLWANPPSPYVWVVLGVTLGFGIIGFYDDYLKVTKQTHEGFAGGRGSLIEAHASRLLACIAFAHLGACTHLRTSLVVPVLQGTGDQFRLVLRDRSAPS